jgi:DNA polymerase-3 subunit gamma/tau
MGHGPPACPLAARGAICYAETIDMSYVVLARKWRPMSFEDLVGQDHVTRTLSNAIETGRIAHAFLFTGVRGIGKTTSARILAKALNCLGDPAVGSPSTEARPTAKPCLRCAACQQIAAGTDVDVREIDGASYTGVDEVRKLQDSLPYLPSRDRYKIFIVDEVHMLSQHAWNAFLKTLEEPPPHVKFIFATTEVHKVPATILSRVQRFDFKLIPSRLIRDRLRVVLQAEAIDAEEAALSVIAREAAGSMRDAMSLLEQVVAWESCRLREADVARVLGVASRQVLHDVARSLLGGDAARCLDVVAQLAAQGFDLGHVARDLLAMLRDLVVAKVCAQPQQLLDLADEEQRDVVALAAAADTDDLLRLHQGFSQGFDDIVRSGQPQAALEMLLVRLARRPPLLPIDDLLWRLAALERRLGTGSRGAASSGTPQQRPPSGGRPRGGADPVGGAGRRSPLRPAPATSPGAADGAERGSSGAESRSAATVSVEPASLGRPKASGEQHAAQGLSPGAAPTAEHSARLACWAAVVGEVRTELPEVAAVLEHAAVLRLDEDQVVLAWENGKVFADRVRDVQSQQVLARALELRLHSRPEVVLEFESARAGQLSTLAQSNEQARQRRDRKAIDCIKHHPTVVEALQILGARIKEVRLAEPPPTS